MNESTQTPNKTDAETLTAAFGRLLEKAQADPELAGLLRQLAALTLSALPEPAPAAEPETAAENAFPPPEPASPDDVAQFLDAFPQRADAFAPPEEEATLAPERVPARLRLKARACLWLCEHGFTADEQALGQRYALIDEGRESDCYLWMLNPYDVSPHASRALGLLAANYEATAAVLEFWLSLEGHALEREVAQLLAEAQAALRTAVSEVRSDPKGAFPWLDEDQQVIFADLKRYGAEQSVYLPHLSLGSRSDPAAYPERQGRLADAKQRVLEEQKQVKAQTEAFNQLKYHTGRLLNRSHSSEHEWKRVAEAVETLLASGVPETDKRLRDPLEPVAALLPEDTPHSRLERMLGALARAADKADRNANPERLPEELPTAEVAEVAGLLGGRTVIVIGGEPKQETVAQLGAAFACRVEWLKAPKHASPSTFKPAIIRSEVLLVLLLIRWSSHVFSEVQTSCSDYGKHLVRVPAGYNVNKLASVILEQVGDKLRADSERKLAE